MRVRFLLIDASLIISHRISFINSHFLISHDLSTLYIIAFFHRARSRREWESKSVRCALEFSISMSIISIWMNTTSQLFFSIKNWILNTESVLIVIQGKLCAVLPANGRINERAVILNWIFNIFEEWEEKSHDFSFSNAAGLKRSCQRVAKTHNRDFSACAEAFTLKIIETKIWLMISSFPGKTNLKNERSF